MDILEQYYKGILLSLKSEVDLINQIFLHQGIKGEGNENVLRELLVKFIPKKYGVSSGIIVDSKGKQSKQCDIIIYDNWHYPEVLSLTSVKLFPVEFVYAVIEVKTTLTKEESLIALENIKSVKSLFLEEERFRSQKLYEAFGDENGNVHKNSLLASDTVQTHPIGLVFSFFSNAKTFDTYMSWFDNQKEFEKFPHNIFCLDQGIITLNQGKELLKIIPFLVDKNENRIALDKSKIFSKNRKKWQIVDGKEYPLTKFNKKDFIVNQENILLHFILILFDYLRLKEINPMVKIREKYLPEAFKHFYGIKNL
jgi:hypothetical protein